MNLTHFLKMLRSRAPLALTILLVTVGTALLVSLLLPRTYESSAQVLIDIKTNRLGGEVDPFTLDKYLATQVDVVQSDRVALRVKELTHLPGELNEILKKLTVKAGRESSVLTISFRAGDPQTAADVANAFAQAYMDVSVEVRTAPAKASSEFLSDQARAAKELLDQAQAKLIAFQRARGMTSADERFDVDSARLTELSSELTRLQAEMASSANRSRMMETRSSDSAEVASNQLIQQLKGTLAGLEGRLNDRMTTLGPNHPEIIRLREEIESLRSRISQETQTIARTVSNTHRVNEQRYAELAAAVERQRAKVIQNRQTREELLTLQRDFEAQQRNFDAIRQKATDQTLESKLTVANAAVLGAAEVPKLPASPNLLLNLIGSVVVGALLSLLTVTVLELSNRRLRLESEIQDAAQAPFIGKVRKVSKRQREMRRRTRGGTGRRPPADWDVQDATQP